jgi:hypothetical protein
VQQSVNSFLLTTPAEAIASSASFARKWPYLLHGATLSHSVTELPAGLVSAGSGLSKLLLKRNCWILRKEGSARILQRQAGPNTPPARTLGEPAPLSWPPGMPLDSTPGVQAHGTHSTWAPKLRLRCCLNGWEGHDGNASRRSRMRTRCRPIAPFIQDTCTKQGGWSKDTEPCRMAFACRRLG